MRYYWAGMPLTACGTSDLALIACHQVEEESAANITNSITWIEA